MIKSKNNKAPRMEPCETPEIWERNRSCRDQKKRDKISWKGKRHVKATLRIVREGNKSEKLYPFSETIQPKHLTKYKIAPATTWYDFLRMVSDTYITFVTDNEGSA